MTPRRKVRAEDTIRGWAWAIAGTVLYSTVLLYAYKTYVQPHFTSDGLTYHSPDQLTYPIVVGLVALTAVLLPRRIDRPSDFVIWLFFVTTAAPAMLLAQYTDNIPVYYATQFAAVTATCMVFIRVGVDWGPRLRLPKKFDPTLVWISMVAFAGLTYLLMIALLGLSLRWVNLSYVYGVRAEYAGARTSAPILGYVLPIVFNVINPTFIARGIYSAQRRWIALGAGGQVLIYVTVGLKSVLFSTVAIFAVAWLFRRDLRLRATKLLTGVVMVAFTAIALDQIFNSFFWDTMFLRRFIVIPGFLPVAYVGLFHDRPRNNFAGSPLFWEHSKYPDGASYIVGKYLTSYDGNNANASLLGHGYYNAGFIGIFIEAAVFVVLLWLVNSASRGLPTPVAALILFMPTFAAASTSVFTVITSHGFLAAIVVLTALPRTGWGRRASPRRPIAASRTGESSRAGLAHR